VVGDCKEPKDISKIAADAQVVLNAGVDITADVIKALRQCKVIIRYGVGVDNIDVEAATAAGIAVCNVPGATTDEVADHTLALALACARQLLPIDKRVRAGEWNVTGNLSMPAFRDMTFGTLGFGRIAKAVLRRAAPFKFRLIGYDPHSIAPEFANAGVTRVTLDELLTQSDILSINAPLTKDTHHLIGAAELARTKPGTIIVNTGRGELIDTPALIEALQSGHVAAAGLDVFEDEPLPPDSPLFKLDNVVLSPHIGAYSARSGENVSKEAAAEALRAVRGEPLQNQVNE
jgi:D-3-phosphoglycerate dehydrogenase